MREEKLEKGLQLNLLPSMEILCTMARDLLSNLKEEKQ